MRSAPAYTKRGTTRPETTSEDAQGHVAEITAEVLRRSGHPRRAAPVRTLAPASENELGWRRACRRAYPSCLASGVHGTML